MLLVSQVKLIPGLDIRYENVDDAQSNVGRYYQSAGLGTMCTVDEGNIAHVIA